MDHTFVFADLAGFTALTEAHGDDHAVDVVQSFYDTATSKVPAGAGEVVKLIGDAVLMRFDRAVDGVASALDIVESTRMAHGELSVRAGAHRGPAVERDGDWFGNTVNIAARVTTAATGGEVLVTEAVRSAVTGAVAVQFADAGERAFKNVSQPMHLFVAYDDRRSNALPIDPVCRMSIDPDHATATLVVGGDRRYFCSLNCLETFAADPEAYGATGDG